MKKLVKNSLIILVALLAVVIVAPSLLSGKISDIVKTEANKMLNAKLDFEKLGISLLRHFPNASLDLKGLTLVGVERFEGDTIVSTVSYRFPPDRVVGVVEKFEATADKMNSEVVVRLAADLSRLDKVLVVKYLDGEELHQLEELYEKHK